jgi:hypothetical protein
MRRLAVAVALLSLLGLGCIDFDARIAECAAGLGPCAALEADGGEPNDGGDGGDGDGGASDGGRDAGGTLYTGPRGFCVDGGFCWVHPRPFGEALLAIDGAGIDDLWVAGRAGLVAHWDGHRWSDRRVPVLGPVRPSDVNTLLVTDDGVWIAGSHLPPRQAQADGSWRAESYVVLGPPTIAQDILQLRPGLGSLVAVGRRDDNALLIATRQADGGWREQDAGIGGDGYALLGGAAPMLAVHRGTNNFLVSLDGDLLATAPTTHAPGVWALWRQPGVGVWVAGEDCLLDLFDGGALQPTQGCPSPPARYRAGRWMSGADANVVVGTASTILEGVNGAFFVPVKEVWMAGTWAEFSDVWVDALGHAVAVSDVALTAWRVPADGHWESANAHLGFRQDFRRNFTSAAAAGDRIYLGGPGSLEASVSLSTGALTALGADSDSNREMRGLWTDGETMLGIESDNGAIGRLCRLGSDGACTELASQAAPLQALWVASPSDVVAVGAGGSLVRWRDGEVRKVPSDGGTETLESVVGGDGRLFTCSWDPVRLQGAIYEINEDLSLTAVYGPVAYKRFAGFAAAPTGELWALGGPNVVLRRGADGVWVKEALPSLRDSVLSGAHAFDARDVWVSGSDGMVLHFDGEKWSYVESGTRVSVARLIGRQVGGTREVWLAGDNGALLVYQYPAP